MFPKFYMHIPKAGGTSIKKAIYATGAKVKECYWAQPGNTIEDILWLDDEEASGIDVVFGHLFFGTHKLMSTESRYYTLLRDPIQRVISQYVYQMDTGALPESASRGGGRASIDELLESEAFEYSNLMCRMISGYGPRRVSAEKLLSRSLKNIEDFFEFVGILEMNDFNILLKKMDLKTTEVPLLNVSRNRELAFKIDASSRNNIYSVNRADVALYDFVSGKRSK